MKNVSLQSDDGMGIARRILDLPSIPGWVYVALFVGGMVMLYAWNVLNEWLGETTVTIIVLTVVGLIFTWLNSHTPRGGRDGMV